MPVNVRYRCNSCGHEFEVLVLTEDERKEARRLDQPIYGINCPKCAGIKLQKISN